MREPRSTYAPALIHVMDLNAMVRAVILIAMAAAAVCSAAQDRFYGRSVVSSQLGIIATTQVQASQARSQTWLARLYLETGETQKIANVGNTSISGILGADPVPNRFRK